MESMDESMQLFQLMARLNIAAGTGSAGEDGEESGVPTEPVLPRQQMQIRGDEVRNNAGGFVFRVDDLTRVRRFLILGTTGGTYYVQEKQLTIDNLAALIEIIRNGKGGMLLREIVEISLAGRAPKQDPTLLALALCARYNLKDRRRIQQNGDEERKFDEYIVQLQKAAMMAVSKVCRIPTHLFAFVKYCEMISKETGAGITVAEQEKSEKPEENGGSTGWGRAMRKCIAEWYLQKPPKELAMHLTKYPSRDGWSHRDLLRLAHPMASRSGKAKLNEPAEQTLVFDQMFYYACHGEFDESKSALNQAKNNENEEAPQLKKARCDYLLTPEMIKCAEESEAIAFMRAAKEAKVLQNDELGDKRCVQLIEEFGLVREHVPTQLLNSTKVWIALLQKMPMTALLRSLSKLATLELLKETENRTHVDTVLSKLLNQDAIHRARIHPISVLLAASVYKHGHGIRGSLSWVVNQRIVKALDEMFLLAFKNVKPTGKRYCLALDVSGSMSTSINGGVLSCREASAAMANVFLRTEQKVECVAFEDKLTELPFTRESTVTQMVDYTSRLSFGATDCSLPMVWAKEKKREFDVFIVFTDSETWAGKVHPFEALKTYRKEMDIPEAKLVVMGMAATEFTIADPSDPGMLDIVGLDAAVPELLRSFVLNEM